MIDSHLTILTCTRTRSSFLRITTKLLIYGLFQKGRVLAQDAVSPRAIVVGYPESVHVAFDANVIRLAKAWRGGFFDAQGTWSGRAGRFFEPYGDDVMQLPPGPALAFLDNAEAPWPPVMMTDRNVGGRFIGYRLDEERRPIFMYELEGVLVEEQPVPVVSAGGANLLRRFSLEATSPSGRLYLLVAEGEETLQNDDGSWTLDGSATVTLRGNAPLLPFVRTSQGVRQLLLPVLCQNSDSHDIPKRRPTALGDVTNTDTKLLICSLFQKSRVLAQDALAEQIGGHERAGGRRHANVGERCHHDLQIWKFSRQLTREPLPIEYRLEYLRAREGAALHQHFLDPLLVGSGGSTKGCVHITNSKQRKHRPKINQVRGDPDE